MDDFSGVIKFLLVAGFVVVSLVRKFAKMQKQQQPAPAPVPRNFSNEMEEIMQQMREEKETQKSVFQTVKPAPKPMQDDLAKSYLHKTPAKKTTPAADISDILLEEKPVYNDLDIKFSNPQDARQAFVYSEIFQRKY